MPRRRAEDRDDARGRDRLADRSRGRDRRRGAHGRPERRPGTSRTQANRPGTTRTPRPTTGWGLVRERLRAKDPAYLVVTLDSSLWIEPFTGRYVPLQGEVHDTARQLYREHPHMVGPEILPFETLMELRWTYDIKRLLPRVSALRIFSPKGSVWLNPYTGSLEGRVQLVDGRFKAETLRVMAKVLAECRQADGGVMLEKTLLEMRCREFGCGPKPITQMIERPAAETPPAEPAQSEPSGKAGAVQRHLLAALPTVPGYGLAVHFSTTEEVSGDLYEVTELPDGRVRCILGDIAGHGVAGAILGATAIKALRMLARAHADTTELLVRLNTELRPDLPPGRFLTLAVAVLEPDTGELTCTLAGHHPFIIANHDSDTPLRLAGRSGMAIGLVGDERFAANLRPVTVTLQPGDVVLQYSDGLVEARKAKGKDEDEDEDEEFGLSRLYAGLIARAENDPQDLVDGLAAEAIAFAGGAVDDDLTLLALAMDRREGTGRVLRRTAPARTAGGSGPDDTALPGDLPVPTEGTSALTPVAMPVAAERMLDQFATLETSPKPADAAPTGPGDPAPGEPGPVRPDDDAPGSGEDVAASDQEATTADEPEDRSDEVTGTADDDAPDALVEPGLDVGEVPEPFGMEAEDEISSDPDPDPDPDGGDGDDDGDGGASRTKPTSP